MPGNYHIQKRTVEKKPLRTSFSTARNCSFVKERGTPGVPREDRGSRHSRHAAATLAARGSRHAARGTRGTRGSRYSRHPRLAVLAAPAARWMRTPVLPVTRERRPAAEDRLQRRHGNQAIPHSNLFFQISFQFAAQQRGSEAEV
ncbi:hypothetical protein QQF64_025910 [Cirrhinus molitorella]|uniref:Uncharacterized protein n=1 Tax=Cirrhinus molitorella TaxID=172907 RepID=A0ABR3NR69_9TELE